MEYSISKFLGRKTPAFVWFKNTYDLHVTEHIGVCAAFDKGFHRL